MTKNLNDSGENQTTSSNNSSFQFRQAYLVWLIHVHTKAFYYKRILLSSILRTPTPRWLDSQLQYPHLFQQEYSCFCNSRGYLIEPKHMFIINEELKLSKCLPNHNCVINSVEYSLKNFPNYYSIEYLQIQFWWCPNPEIKTSFNFMIWKSYGINKIKWQRTK